MSQTKLELILEAKNRMTAGLSEAKKMVSGKVAEIKSELASVKNASVASPFRGSGGGGGAITPKINRPDTTAFDAGIKAARSKASGELAKVKANVKGNVSVKSNLGSLNNGFTSFWSRAKAGAVDLKNKAVTQFNGIRSGLSNALSGNPFSGLSSQASGFGRSAVQAFSAAKQEIPGLSRLLDIVTNKYVLMTAATVALAAGLTTATLKAADFDYAFLDVRQLNLDKSKDTLDGYRKKVLDTAFDSGISATKMAQGFYDIQSGLGLFGDDVARVNKRIGDFSIATKADFNDSINATIKSMAAFKFGVADLDNYLASNAKTVQVGITTFKELAAVQTEYAGAAASANQNFDTANKLFASFTKVGKDSTTAATLVKTAFQGISQKTTLDGFKKMGISLFDAKGQMRELTAIIGESVPKIQKMSDFEFSKLRNEIGGPEGLQALFNQMRTDGQGMLDTFAAFDASKFNIDDALKNAKGDFNTLKDIVGNRFNVVMIELGTTILPYVARGLEFVNTTIQALRSFLSTYSSEIQTFFTILKQTAIGLAGAFVLIKAPAVATFLALKAGAIASSIANLGVAGSLQAIKVAFMSIPIIGWIAAAVAGFVTLYNTVDWFRAGVDGVVNVFKELLKLAKPLGEILLGIATNNYAKIGQGITNLKDAWSTVDIKNAYRKGYDESMAASARDREAMKAGTAVDQLAVATANSPAASVPLVADGSGGVSSLEGSKTSRNITVNLEALHKGDNNLYSSMVQGATNLDDFQRMMEEYALRLIRNIETSQG
ncbi:MAG: phage tail tape measure protein [Imperialibacter sp.]|uniref:phage tail tape measure protein n=1 Tax=Imperialibacter sp. TaxID=2038411 RepID=UPI0032EC959A